MIFNETPLKGAFIIDLEKREDERGFFARTWCANEMKVHGQKSCVAQANMSYSYKKGTLRGMHYQKEPYKESKMIQCIRGAVYDVIIDLRPDSPTFKQWIGTELTAYNYRMLYVPEDFAHGFITLEDNTEVAYMVSQFYAPGFEAGVRYDDPAFGIQWPMNVQVISQKDANWPNFQS